MRHGPLTLLKFSGEKTMFFANLLPRIRRIVFVGVLASVGLALHVAPSWAANPSLGNISPAGGRRGTEVEATFSGARLKDAQSLFFYSPGISLKGIEPVNETSFKAKLTIAADCDPGLHAIRVRTASGVSNLQLFSVGALQEVAEVEPNSEFIKPQAIELETTVVGSIGNEDVDYFVVSAKKGERITAEVEGIRLGRAFFDTYVAIMDKDRFELSNSDDAAQLWLDGVASVIAPEDGQFIVQVRESSFSAGSNYRLHVGRFPRPLAVLPAGGRLGETLDLHFLGDVAGDMVKKVTLPKELRPLSNIYTPDNQGTSLFYQDDKGISPAPLTFRITDLGNVLEVEPNDDPATATSFEAPMALNGLISKPGDVDLFKFKAKKGDRYEVRVHGRSIRSPLDSVLTITRIGGAAVGTNDDSGTPDSYLRFAAPVDDEYVIKVSDMLAKGGPTFAYRVEVSPMVPGLTLSLPERVQYEDVTTSVPQGNRMALMINAARRDFGGDLAVDIKDLPPGLKVEALPMPANMSTVAVILTAAADAPLGGTLADVVGTTTDPKLGVTGHMEQKSLLVRGNNNRPVFTYTGLRMATAVTEKVPYKIEVIEPKVPLVRNGSMDLKVKATRDAGFTAPISIRLLFNPSGVSSSGSATIPEGKDEGVIPLTANGGAEIRVWQIAVIGQATVGDGPVMVSSQFAKLDVADAFFQFAFKPTAAEQGKETDLVIAVTQTTPFEGKAKVELLGLPAEAVSEPVEIAKDATEVVFNIKSTAKTPAGRHKSILCRVSLEANGEPIIHTLGPGELRIDAPLPPKPAVAAKPAAEKPATPPPAVAAKPASKPLSRLEKLRQEREGNKSGGGQ